MQSIEPVLPNWKGDGVQEFTIAKNQPPYKPLHIAKVRYDDGTISMIARYSLTWEERFRLFFLGELWSELLTFGQPRMPERITTFEPLTEADKEPKEKPCHHSVRAVNKGK